MDEPGQKNSSFTYSSLYFTSMFPSQVFRMGFSGGLEAQLFLLESSSIPLCCTGSRFSVSGARFSDIKTFLFSSLCERKQSLKSVDVRL